jgi:hypothetical protein
MQLKGSGGAFGQMIDNFALGLTHGLLLLAAWRLVSRVDLDHEAPPQHEAPPVTIAQEQTPHA